MSYLPCDLTLSTTLDNTQVQANDAALDTAISGNLTELNLSAATRIPNSMLASPNIEEIIELSWCDEPGFSSPGQAAATGVKDVYRIAGSATYTILSASYVVNNTTATTAGSTTIAIEAGSYVANVWTATTTIVTAVAVASQGSISTTQGDFTLAATSFSAPNQIAIRIPAAGTSHVFNIKVTLRVTRSLQ